MEIITKSPEETKNLGRKIASDLIHKKPKERPIIIALTGDLGSGKTTFVQGVTRALDIDKRITSPTFIIVRRYKALLNFYHIDLYRLDEDVEEELKNIGFNDLISDPSNFIVVEWAEKAKEIIPDDALWINFENLGEEKRSVQVDFLHRE